MKKVILSVFFSVLSICAFANSFSLDAAISKVESSKSLINSTILRKASCSFASGTVYCENGSSGKIYTSIYQDNADTVMALANNASNFCDGGGHIIKADFNSTICP